MESIPASDNSGSQRPHGNSHPKQSDLRIKLRPDLHSSQSSPGNSRLYVIERKSCYSLRDAARVSHLSESQLRRAILLGELVGIEVADDRHYLVTGEHLRAYLLSRVPRAVIRDPASESDPGSIAALVILILIPLLALASIVMGALSTNTSERPGTEIRPISPPFERMDPQYGTDLLESPSSGGKNPNEPSQGSTREHGARSSTRSVAPPPPRTNPGGPRGVY